MVLRILGCLVLLAVAACGNGDAKLESEARAVCDAIQVGTTTILQVDQRATFGPFYGGCAENLKPFDGAPPGACGEPASVCQLRWEWPSSSDCGPQGGCTYACDVRVQDTGGAAPSTSAVICEKRFLKQQPYY